MACNNTYNKTFSQIVATPPPKKKENPQVARHKPNPNSFTAQTGQHFRPPETRKDHDYQKILITSSQEEVIISSGNADSNNEQCPSNVPDDVENTPPLTETAAANQTNKQTNDSIQKSSKLRTNNRVAPGAQTIPTAQSQKESFQCILCFRPCKSQGGLTKHLNKCRKSSTAVNTSSQPTHTVPEPEVEQAEAPTLTTESANVFENYIQDHTVLSTMYDAIVYWRRNLFTLPSGAAGKLFIKESTRLINAWSMKSVLRPVAMKLLMIMPALLLQKITPKSKAKDHTEALKRRMGLWEKGKLDELFFEAISIQRRLKNTQKSTTIESIAKRFSAHMMNGRVSAAIKLLSEESDNGILPINDDTMKLLHEKHPNAVEPEPIAMMPGIIQPVHPSVFEQINGEMIQKIAGRTKGGAGPSGMNADDWSRILASNKYALASSDCREAIALMTRTMCSEKINADDMPSIEALIGCRLLPLNKNPGCRPIGIGEILRRIMSKAAMAVFTDDVIQSAGCVQICAGHKGGAEAAIHAVRQIFEENDDYAVVLIDASNAFNSLNRKAALHNIGVLCPIMHTFACNLYQPRTRLFVQGGAEIASSEGTTQGGPESMAIYALATIPLLNSLKSTQPVEDPVKHVAYADDAVGAGKICNLRLWWDAICENGPRFGYHINAKKSWIIVKPHLKQEAEQTFQGTGINITADGQRHIGASIGSIKYREKFVSNLINDWSKQIGLLSRIAKIDPHSAYAAYTNGLRHKFNYVMRTIPDTSTLLQPLENAIKNQLIPALTEQFQIGDVERDIIALPVRLGGLGIPNPCKDAEHEFNNSSLLTRKLTEAIIHQESTAPDNTEDRAMVSKANAIRQNAKKETIMQSLPVNQQKHLKLNQQKGASSWLTALPLEEHGFHLTKRQFWDSIRMRYAWPLTNTPSTCACSKGFSVTHALSCHLGGFTSIRHNELRDLTGELLQQACHDVRIEPPLEPLTGESFDYRSTNKADEARLDISARGLFVPYQKVFADVRVINPMAKRYEQQSPEQILETNEKEKKRQYCKRVLEVENATFSPLVFTTNGGMGRECLTFYNRLAQELARKWKTIPSQTISWIRTRLSFALCRSTHMCVRGSRRWNKLDAPVNQEQVELYSR